MYILFGPTVKNSEAYHHMNTHSDIRLCRIARTFLHIHYLCEIAQFPRRIYFINKLYLYLFMFQQAAEAISQSSGSKSILRIIEVLDAC